MIWPAWTQQTRTQNQLGHHEQISRALSGSQQAMVNQITQLSNQVATLTSQLTPAVQPSQHAPPAPPSVPPSPRESYASHPEPVETWTSSEVFSSSAPWFLASAL